MTECDSCALVKKVMERVDSCRGYWLATELFMELHNGVDFCKKNEEETEVVSE